MRRYGFARSITLGALLVMMMMAASTPARAGNPPIVELSMNETLYQDMYANLPAGYRPISVTAYGPQGMAGFTAAFIDDGVPFGDWIARHGMTAQTLEDEIELYRPQGYRVFCVDSYGQFPNERYTALWVKDAQNPTDWEVYTQVQPANLINLVNNEAALNRVPVWISGTEGANARIAVAFDTNDEGYKWDYAFGMSEAGYQDTVNAFLPVGSRVTCVTMYGDPAAPLYAAIWFRPDGPNWELQNAWSARHDDDLFEHEDYAQNLIDAGYVPSSISQSVNVLAGEFASAWYRPNEPEQLTITGPDVPALSDLDDVMVQFMQDRKISHGALAVTRDGRLELARGYNWAPASEPLTTPETKFRVASVSKPLTAVGVMKMIESGQYGIDLDTTLAEIPGMDTSGWIDGRLVNNSLRWLLQHRGGWDRDSTKTVFGLKSVEWSPVPVIMPEPGFDPMFRDFTIADELGVPLPITQSHVTQYMKNYIASFEPGDGYAYSNFGYMLLGRVIEAVTGEDYETWTRDNVLCPIGAGGMFLGTGPQENVQPDEVPYRHAMRILLRNVYGLSPEYRPWQYGGFNIDNMDAHGGWVSSVVDMARFTNALSDETDSPLLSEGAIDFLFDPTSDSGNSYAAGFQVSGSLRYHNGSLRGTWAYIARRDDGITWVAFFNQRSESNLPTGNWANIRPNLESAISGIQATGGFPGNDFWRMYDSDRSECPIVGKDAVHNGQVRGTGRRP